MQTPVFLKQTPRYSGYKSKNIRSHRGGIGCVAASNTRATPEAPSSNRGLSYHTPSIFLSLKPKMLAGSYNASNSSLTFSTSDTIRAEPVSWYIRKHTCKIPANPWQKFGENIPQTLRGLSSRLSKEDIAVDCRFSSSR